MRQHLHPLKWEGYPLSRPFRTMLYRLTRRLLDIFVGLLGCLCVLLFSPLLWMVNQLYAPGPLFYRQIRIGKHERPFTIIKFRSMRRDAEAAGAQWSTERDTRITPIGHFLRRTHLDELPQFWNILKGEMSLIGPRPERPNFVRLLTEQIEDYPLRHQLKPGLTGWAQVNYGYGRSVEDARMKLKYDLAYLNAQSWRLDLIIVLRTFTMICRGQ